MLGATLAWIQANVGRGTLTWVGTLACRSRPRYSCSVGRHVVGFAHVNVPDGVCNVERR